MAKMHLTLQQTQLILGGITPLESKKDKKMSADTLPISNRTYQQSMDALNQLMHQNPTPSIRQLMELIEKTSVIPPNVNVNTVFLLY